MSKRSYLSSFFNKKPLSIGNKAEKFALLFLKKQGLTFIDKNFFYRRGEIDLIMMDKQQLVFIEVRYRKSKKYGSALESVTQQKQQRIIKTSQYFLLKNKQYRQSALRFDVIAFQKDISTASMTWIKAAF